MDKIKYIGLDVHRDTISAAVLNESGRLLQQSVLMTRTAAILDFIGGVRGSLHVTFEEGTHSAWLYDLLSRRVDKLVVCNPRKNALLKSGNKGDAIDARKLADLLRAGLLSPVYHGETSALEVQQLARSYLMLTEDTTRAMGRLKAVFRGQAISCTGRRLYGPKHRGEYLEALGACALRRRAERLYQQLDALQQLRRDARHDLIVECRKHAEAKWLQTVPFLGPLRAAVLIGRVQTPHRFRTKRQFWTYCGLALETHDSAEYRVIDGQVERKKRPAQVRGLNWNYNHELKNVFKGAANAASTGQGVFREFYLGLLKKGMRPEMARLTLARKIAAIALKIWKKGESFDAEHLKSKAA
ncbi:IS110 family transposase [Terracidiphilus sp.]|jgi:transposase|uniref:IS110 family transposase n=1 Tax=Terracidiphilus sp. TaxID=1964191 RepID=UPI003C2101AE